MEWTPPPANLYENWAAPDGKQARKNVLPFPGPLSNICRRGNVVCSTLGRRNDMPNICH
jgi:hypothetical protein